MDIAIATNNSYMSSALNLVPGAIKDFNATIARHIASRKGAEENSFPSDITSLRDVSKYVADYASRKGLLESSTRLGNFPADAKFPGNILPKGMLQDLMHLSNNIELARLHCSNEEVRDLLKVAQAAYTSSGLGARLQQLMINTSQAQEELFRAQAGAKGRI